MKRKSPGAGKPKNLPKKKVETPPEPVELSESQETSGYVDLQEETPPELTPEEKVCEIYPKAVCIEKNSEMVGVNRRFCVYSAHPKDAGDMGAILLGVGFNSLKAWEQSLNDLD